MRASELAKVPYLRTDSFHGRSPVLLPYWSGSEWMLWVSGQDGTLINLRPVDVVRSEYVAREAKQPSDLYFPFLNFMWQHLSWSEMTPATKAILDDLRNLAASFGKLEFFWLHRAELRGCLSEFVTTETEYIFTVARGILEHLQETVALLWRRTRLHPSLETPLRKLPNTMHEMVFNKKLDRPRTAAELTEEFGLPQPLVEFYLARAPFVLSFGRLRNAIIHRGQEGGPVFVTERGYGIPVGGELHGVERSVWKAEHALNSNVVSLKPLLAHSVMSALDACSEATEMYVKMIACPPEMMPGFRVFTRIPQANALLRAQSVLQGGSAWWDGAGDAFEPG